MCAKGAEGDAEKRRDGADEQKRSIHADNSTGKHKAKPTQGPSDPSICEGMTVIAALSLGS
jgi:hypothetical protein